MTNNNKVKDKICTDTDETHCNGRVLWADCYGKLLYMIVMILNQEVVISCHSTDIHSSNALTLILDFSKQYTVMVKMIFMVTK